MSAVTVIRHLPPPIIGVCAPVLDHRFQELEAALDWLEVNGIVVHRIDPVTDAAELQHLPDVERLWRTRGASGLPIVVIDNQVVSHGHFPSRHELAHFVAARHVAGSLDAVRHVASLAVAAALGAPDDVRRERVAAEAAGLNDTTLDIVEDAARQAIEARTR